MSVLDEVAAHLASNGVGTVGTDLFKGIMPEGPVNVVTVYEYPGSGLIEGFGFDGGEQPNIQVMVRNQDYEQARIKAKSAWDVLRAVSNEDLSGVRYFRISVGSSPAGLGRDSNRNALVGFSARVQKAIS